MSTSFHVPDACTLPTVERPVRLAEFDTLFATSVRAVQRVSAHHSRLRLAGPAGLRATVRDLTARETGCCSFFTFTVVPIDAARGEAVTLDIEVPPAYADVLASLTQRARTLSAELGYADVRVYDGGEADWAGAGLPLHAPEPPRTRDETRT